MIVRLLGLEGGNTEKLLNGSWKISVTVALPLKTSE